MELTLIERPRATQTDYMWNFAVKMRCQARRVIFHEFYNMVSRPGIANSLACYACGMMIPKS